MSSYGELLSHIQSAFNSLKKGGRFCGIASAYSDQFPLKGENIVMKGQTELHFFAFITSNIH